MTPEQAAQLRAPFPPESIGQLPRGGVMLDYVGHAATTDRLLQVDPEWSWEPMCVGPNGEPLLVDGGLWIQLTVAGVTRPGFGDGPSVKEMIGDAIRNAAMRFGVALDLWAKEKLEHSGAATPVALPAPEKPPDVDKKQHATIGALANDMNKIGGEGADWVAWSRNWCFDNFGKRSRAELTHDEADLLIAELRKQKADLEARF